MRPIVLDGESLNLDSLDHLTLGAPAALSEATLEGVAASEALVRQTVEDGP